MKLPSSQEAFEYATRVCQRLPQRLISLREVLDWTQYELWQNSGVSRSMVGMLETAGSAGSLFVSARLAYGVRLTLTEFVSGLEDDA